MNTATKLLTVLGGAGQSYADKMASYAGLIAYWRLNEASGTNAVNAEGTAARDGTYSASDIAGADTGPGGDVSPLFDPATGDEVNIQTASLASALNGQEFTISCWVKVSGVGVWTDSTQRGIYRIYVSGTDSIRLWKDANSRLLAYYEAGNVIKNLYLTSLSFTDWRHIAITGSLSNDRYRVYYQGVQTGADATSLGTWAGTPAVAAIGSGTGGATPWSGSIAEVAIYTQEHDAATIAEMATI